LFLLLGCGAFFELMTSFEIIILHELSHIIAEYCFSLYLPQWMSITEKPATTTAIIANIRA
jgi:hypothetical protein